MGDNIEWLATLPEARRNDATAAEVATAQSVGADEFTGELLWEAGLPDVGPMEEMGSTELAIPLYADAERDAHDAFIFLPLVVGE